MWSGLYHGWVELLTLFAMLLAGLVIMGWSYNRGFRPADRGAVVGWFPLIVAFGVVILLRQMQAPLVLASIIAVGMLIAGLLSLQHALPGLVGDRHDAVEHARDGRDRHLCASGYVPDGR